MKCFILDIYEQWYGKSWYKGHDILNILCWNVSAVIQMFSMICNNEYGYDRVINDIDKYDECSLFSQSHAVFTKVPKI